MKVAVILFNVDLKEFSLDGYYKIGCDRGALNAISQGYCLDTSIGDFDSVSKTELKKIEENSKKIIKLNPIKDKTDVEEALDIAYTLSDDVTIFGGISGNRIEHFISILSLFKRYKTLKLIDNNSTIIYKDKSFSFKKYDFKEYMFVSIIPQTEELFISLEGFKYNLSNKHYTSEYGSLLISNQMVEETLEIMISAPIILIFSKLDNSNNIA